LPEIIAFCDIWRWPRGAQCRPQIPGTLAATGCVRSRRGPARNKADIEADIFAASENKRVLNIAIKSIIYVCLPGDIHTDIFADIPSRSGCTWIV